VICNSAYLADKKNLLPPSDSSILGELSRPEKIRIVERLSDGAAKQKEIEKDLGLSSGSLSRWLRELAQAQIVYQDRPGTHDPYRLVKPERTNELLDLVALLASELSDAYVERAERRADANKARLRERRERST